MCNRKVAHLLNNKLRMKKKAYISPNSISIEIVSTSMLCGSKTKIGSTNENVDNSDKSNSCRWSSSLWGELNKEESEE